VRLVGVMLAAALLLGSPASGAAGLIVGSATGIKGKDVVGKDKMQSSDDLRMYVSAVRVSPGSSRRIVSWTVEISNVQFFPGDLAWEGCTTVTTDLKIKLFDWDAGRFDTIVDQPITAGAGCPGTDGLTGGDFVVVQSYPNGGDYLSATKVMRMKVVTKASAPFTLASDRVSVGT
jgi:hypothetical protein